MKHYCKSKTFHQNFVKIFWICHVFWRLLIIKKKDLRCRVKHVTQHETLGSYRRRRVGLYLRNNGLAGRHAERIRRRLRNLHSGALCELKHQLETARRSQIDAGPIQFVRIQNRRTLLLQIQSFRHVAHFHRPTGEFEAVQLF